jgi:hypothetical protein
VVEDSIQSRNAKGQGGGYTRPWITETPRVCGTAHSAALGDSDEAGFVQNVLGLIPSKIKHYQSLVMIEQEFSFIFH